MIRHILVTGFKVYLFPAIFIAVMFVTTVAAHAQEIPPIEEPVADTTWRLIVATVISALLAFSTESPLTVFLTSVVKHIPALKDTPGQYIQIAMGAVVLSVTFVVTVLGFRPQFDEISDWVVTIGPATLNIILTYFFAQRTYHALKANGVPFLGHDRDDHTALLNQ